MQANSIFLDNISYICDTLNLYKIKYSSTVKAQCKQLTAHSNDLTSEQIDILLRLGFKYIGNDSYAKQFNMSYKYMHSTKQK